MMTSRPNSNPSSHTPHPPPGRRTGATPFGAVNVGGGNQRNTHVIDATFQQQFDIIDQFVLTRNPGDVDFTVPTTATNTLMNAIDGDSTNPSQNTARNAFVDALLRCPKDQGPNRTCFKLLRCCMLLFHFEIQPNGTIESGAQLCGERMTKFLRTTFNTDDEERNMKQALLLMYNCNQVKPFDILRTTPREQSSFIVSDFSNMFLKASNLVDTSVPVLFRVCFAPNKEQPYNLKPGSLLVTTLTMLRKMVFTMSLNTKWFWMKDHGHSGNPHGHGGYRFLHDLFFKKYIPHSNIADPQDTSERAVLNGTLAHLVMDIQCALQNRNKDTVY